MFSWCIVSLRVEDVAWWTLAAFLLVSLKQVIRISHLSARYDSG